MNVLLIEDPYIARIINKLDDELDYILEILEKEAWSIFNDEDYDP